MISHFLVLLLSVITAVTSMPVVYWKGTSGDYDMIRVKMEVLESNYDKGYFFSTQVNFYDHRVAYIGMQPRKGDQNLLIFSVFGKGTQRVDLEHCKAGADYTSGTSCSSVYPWKVNKEYICEIKLVNSNATDNTWQGSFIDAETDEVLTTIGTWSTPISAGKLQGNGISFDEYVLWNTDKRDPKIKPCLPKSSVKIWPPTLYHSKGYQKQSKMITFYNFPAFNKQDKCAYEQQKSNIVGQMENGTAVFYNGVLSE